MRLLVVLLSASASLLAQAPQEARLQVAGQEVAYLLGEAASLKPAPLLILLSGESSGGIDTAKAFYTRWQPVTAGRQWNLAVPWLGAAVADRPDPGVKALEAIVQDAGRRLPVDPTRVYLAGFGADSARVVYAISRAADLWAAAMAVGGNPKPAIDTNRLFGANASLVPLLWILQPQEQAAMEPLRAKLAGKGFVLELRADPNFTFKDALDWASTRARQRFPAKVDCETGSTGFPRCYWLEMIKVDLSLRNDVLDSTRVQPGSGAHLDLGGFGFSPSAPGPGILVGWLPDNYKGPLKLQDRIVSVGGRAIRDAADYEAMMDGMNEEKGVALLIERGGKRQRIETRLLVAKRDENATVRVQAEYLPQIDEVQIITRGVAGLRITLPAAWTPCRITWNGDEVAKAAAAGCWAATFGNPGTPCTP